MKTDTGAGHGLLVGHVLHSEAVAFNSDSLGMVEQAVEDGGGQGRIVVEDLGPVLEHAIGGDCDGAAFVSLVE